MASQKLTEYERKRLENIKRNEEMMAALKVQSKAASLAAISKRQSVKSYQESSVKKPKTETPIVIRRSLRTRGMPPDSKGLDDEFRENSVKIPNFEKQSPRPLGPLSMNDAFCGDNMESNKLLIGTILSVAKKNQVGVSVKGEFNDGEDVKEENLSYKKGKLGSFESEVLECPLKVEKFDENLSGESGFVTCGLVKGVVQDENLHGLVEIEMSDSLLESMDLKPENVARVFPGRAMLVKFFPCSNMRMIAAGNKSGNIAFWNVDWEDENGDGIYLYRPHEAPISGILIQQHSMSKIFTSCYDGFLRVMDAEKEVFDLLHHSDDTIFCLSQQASNLRSLYFGEGLGGLNMLDIRTRKCSKSWHLHERRISTIDFNSQNPNIMATSSTDGTACIWDLRRMSANKPQTLKTVSHSRAVTAAYFSPSGNSLATTSYDDKVGIISGNNYEDISMIYHNNQTGRWLSSFRAIWGWDDSYIFIGNMKRGVDVISSSQRKIVMTLESPNMSAIPCRFDAHPHEVGLLAAATSGGQVYVWKPC